MKEKEIGELAERLAKRNFPLKPQWLRTCVEYLEHSVGKKATTCPEMLQNLVIEQFVNSPIVDTYQPLMKIPKAAVKVVIVKRMIFQMQSYTNISVSLYEQFSEATRHNDDLSWFHGTTRMEDTGDEEEKERDAEPRPMAPDKNNNKSNKPSENRLKKKRGMLKLELTDGINTLNAIELEETFDEKQLVPGVKIAIIGKVKCRRGTLLLDKSNCLLLGGFVDSIKIDIVKTLADALKIDLDAGKKRKKKPLETAPTISSKSVTATAKKSANTSKNNKSLLNQSTISPFLVKTDRKTGQVRNPEKKTKNTEKEEAENWDFSIEELPPAQEPTPEPPESHFQDTIDVNFTWNPEPEKSSKPVEKAKIPTKIVQKTVQKPEKPVEKPQKCRENSEKILEKLSEKWEKQKEKRVEDWTFNLSSSFENVPKTAAIRKPEKPAKPAVKKLPEELLRKDDSFEEVVNCSVDEDPVPVPVPITERIAEKSMNNQSNDKDWDRKGSEEEEIPTKRQRDDTSPVAILPSCFFNQSKDRSETQNPVTVAPTARPFARTIHGPRYDANVPFRKPEKLEKPITDHFPTVKNPQIPPGKSVTAEMNLSGKMKEKNPRYHEIVGYSRPRETVKEVREAEKAAEEEEEKAEEIMEQEEDEEEEEEEERRIVQTILAKMQHQPLPTSAPPISSNFDEEDDSILECTMEQEGRMELQRWGLGGNSHSDRYQSIMEQDDDLLDGYTHQQSQYPYQSAYQHYQQYSADNQCSSSEQWTSTVPPQSADFMAPRVKMEDLEEEKQRKAMIIQLKRKRREVEEEEGVKNKQSANVQIYKTPFAKRIPSSDDSASVTEQLFQRMADLHIVPLGDALLNRKFWMMSKIVVVMPTICHQVHELKSDGIDWQLQMRISDTSASDVTCLVATSLLNRIFGFSVQQCKQLFNAKQFNELRVKKAEAERKLIGFKRLDLLIWVEVSPEIDKLPMILDVKTISDALNIL